MNSKDWPHRFSDGQSGHYCQTSFLQVALREARSISTEELAGLEEGLAGVRRLAKIEHPAYFRVRDALHRAWTPDITKEERRTTSRLAIDSLIIASLHFHSRDRK